MNTKKIPSRGIFFNYGLQNNSQFSPIPVLKTKLFKFPTVVDFMYQLDWPWSEFPDDTLFQGVSVRILRG